uniref:Uncharacterized protein n=1 Tax=viral metagenome TaxID=1070528 RepID=A0A6C0BJE5_9ZZZZ
MGKNSNNTPPIVAIQTAIGAAVGTGAAAVAATSAVDPTAQLIGLISTSPWIAGLCYVIVNLGGKHIAMNLTPEQEKMLGSAWIRPIIIFCLCFVATRNIITAFWLTMAFMLVFYVIFYEASPLCLLRVIPKQDEPPKAPDYPSSQQQQGQQPQPQPSAPAGSPSMIPLFMKGPLAVPDPNLAVEEANYLKNMKMF